MKRRGELSEKELKLIKTKISDEEAFKLFERDCLLRNLRPATLKYYKNELAAVKTSITVMGIEKEIVDLQPKDIENIILHLKLKIKVVSINTQIRAMKTFFNFLYRKKLVTPNPMRNIKQLRDRRKVMETLDDKEIELIASYIKKQKSFVGVRDYVIFMIMLDTGLRLSELAAIKIEDVRGSKLIIRETKNLLERNVYLSKRVQDELSIYMKLRGNLHHSHLLINVDNEPLKSRSIQTRFEKYRKATNLDKQFSPHILRHTYAKRAIINGMDAFSLAALLGHSDLTVTKRYVSLWGMDLEEKAKKHSSINKLNI